MSFEVFEHTADLGIRVTASSEDELFAEAARALFSVIVANPDSVQPVVEKAVEVAGDQRDYLLFDWLTELLYLFESQQLLLAEFTVRLEAHGLRGIARGEPLDRERHQLDHEVKAVTYHRLRVQSTALGWQAEFIVDI